MESEIIFECFWKLLLKHCVVAQIAIAYYNTTTIALLQKTRIADPAYRLYGGEVSVDMKADDRRLNKTIKSTVRLLQIRQVTKQK